PATDRFGNPCGAFRFIGTGCYISVPNSTSLKSPINALTITAWVRPEKTSTSSNDLNLILLAKPGIELDANIRPQYCFQIKRTFGDSYSTVTLSSDFSFQDRQYNSHPMEFNQWYFIAVTYDENFVQVYQDGKLICQAPKNKPFGANDFALEIGRDIVTGKKYFNGSLDDVRIYNRGLSMAEVNELYKDESGKVMKQDVSLSFPKSVEKNTESGKCYATVFYAEPTLTMGCGSEVLKQTAGAPSGSQFNPGRNNLVYETMLGDKVMRDSFQITVRDNEPPVFKCPTDVVAKARAGTAGVEVYYPALSVSDNCPNLKLELLEGLKSGGVFPIGTTTLKYEATDAGGNKSQCVFKVTVTGEDAPPVAKTEGKHVVYDEEVRDRNSPAKSNVPTLLITPTEKKTTAKVKDMAPGKDIEPPNFNCPLDTMILLPPNRKGVIYHYKDPKATDNVGVDSVVQIAGSKDGCFLTVGVHPFIFRAYDKAGNTQTCTYSVMIKEDGTAKPYLPPAKLEADLELGSDSVHYEHKASLSKCDLTVLIYDDGEQDNDSVSIIFNGEVIVNRDMIRVKENGVIKRNITLTPNAENFIIAKAWNTGRFGLNTLRIDVYDNSEGSRKDLRTQKPLMSKILHSRPGNAGGLLLKCE
ncbi:MAG TPA: HYR domain-containing protein, partial [Chitinophagales bacterium]|nr:HYR domain-containing protein [Chitinophagales bacterium]